MVCVWEREGEKKKAEERENNDMRQGAASQTPTQAAVVETKALWYTLYQETTMVPTNIYSWT